MNDYIPELKEQHDRILSLASKLSSSPSLDLLHQISEQLQHHHNTEMQLLFTRVNHQAFKQGGPFCSIFFDFFINNRPLQKTSSLIEKLTGKPTTIEIPVNLKHYFLENSLVSIPLEEHIAMQTLAKALADNFNTADKASVTLAIDYLADLISLNFRKEETCFWEVAKPMLNF